MNDKCALNFNLSVYAYFFIMSWGINVHNFDSLVVVSLQSNFVEKQAEGFVASVPSSLGKRAHVCGKPAKFLGASMPPGFVASVPSSLGKRAHVCGKRAKFLGASMPQVLWQASQVFWARMSSFGWQACHGILGQAAQCVLSLAIWDKQTLHIYYLNDFIMLAFCSIWELAKVCGNKYSGLTVPKITTMFH